MPRGAGEELLEAVDRVVRELALGVPRGSGGTAAVVVDGHAPISERVAQRLNRERVEAQPVGDQLELGFPHEALPLTALDQRLQRGLVGVVGAGHEA